MSIVTSKPEEQRRSQPIPRVITVGLDARTYNIAVGPSALSGADWRQILSGASSVWIISNTTIWPFAREALTKALKGAGCTPEVLLLEDGERFKTLDVTQRIWTGLLEGGADRRALLLALGGGVVGDITGFAAACYQRGVAFVQVPTTLLSMVDSSVGGKTGVNHPLGKNMIGAFYQPKAVLCDTSTLESLPPREYASGIAEVIKYGAIYDVSFFEQLERQMDALLQRDTHTLVDVISRCCEIKAAVVAADEREAGLREILNFGHTFGHAIETGMGYGAWLHGEAVAAGMVMAAELSCSLGQLAQPDVTRLRSLVARAGLPVKGPTEVAPQSYLALMRHDKKARHGSIRYVLLDGLGSARTQAVSDEAARAAIEAANTYSDSSA